MLSLIIGLLSGVICAAPFIISKVPSMKDHLAKVTPYTGWVGVCVLFWGIREILGAVLGIALMKTNFLTWLFWLLAGTFDLGAGLLLGSGLVLKWTLGKDPAKQAMVSEKIGKLAPYQLIIGFGQIIMSVLYFVL
ncbi:MAG: hypothetical protein IPG50_21665 [Myxococcales bacterium]|nr:hypothetical protein [Myxococcales bacterium]